MTSLIIGLFVGAAGALALKRSGWVANFKRSPQSKAKTLALSSPKNTLLNRPLSYMVAEGILNISFDDATGEFVLDWETRMVGDLSRHLAAESDGEVLTLRGPAGDTLRVPRWSLSSSTRR